MTATGESDDGRGSGAVPARLRQHAERFDQHRGAGDGGGAHTELATVLGYVGAAVVEAACVRAPMTRAAVTPGGTVDDAGVRRQLAAALAALRAHVLGSPDPRE